MPRRGYRKGVSDDRTPVPRRIHTRLPEDVYAKLAADTAARNRPASAIIRAILTAHYRHQRAELPHPAAPTHAAVRELRRIGNNLNQIAHLCHANGPHLLEREARSCLRAVLDAVLRL